MEGKVTFSVLTENHEGPIGEDWRYWIEAKVFNQGLKGQGTIRSLNIHYPVARPRSHPARQPR